MGMDVGLDASGDRKMPEGRNERCYVETKRANVCTHSAVDSQFKAMSGSQIIGMRSCRTHASVPA
ncbi:hypothetical protein QT199_005240 [Xanthomonas phaseoli pv. phaseoli]|uniref:Uncharacterized protein n=1 Tax=Xanthomonas campestris pv. phaseoli TaxID=317013 RepID=A0AB34QSY3_XANCH|nr:MULTISPECIES: hypothetical protein [Xanthomonas]ATS21152.1 hypothetical protein XppCFBP412P_06510 [Xanthomonas phaseoli pv. phaseoli]ATS27825.1 hypothetical protein XppCFBP6164P_21935 [Xanthomonas phaseoli pv. phaseoli]ATS31643.1 hypothetical protein XppCFBP6546P_19900 [Xanthomonas phaseoli pv. phaseoli]ATS36063.1 hypothetical protein XppCFBP6982P_21295 [Xanthomonas phaseoli pv. phaseoli]AZU12999.1 hypothetical protein AC609_09860 [Xanthomonas phaseoli pv. phaseoli]